MSAASEGLRRFLREPGSVEVCLAFGESRVTAPILVDSWRTGVTSDQTTVRFGPFPDKVNADGVLVYVNGAGPDRLPFDSTLGLPPGQVFVYDLSVAVT